MESALISGIAFNRDEAKLTILGVPDKPGVAAQILSAIAEGNIDVDMIVQNTGEDGRRRNHRLQFYGASGRFPVSKEYPPGDR